MVPPPRSADQARISLRGKQISSPGTRLRGFQRRVNRSACFVWHRGFRLRRSRAPWLAVALLTAGALGCHGHGKTASPPADVAAYAETPPGGSPTSTSPVTAPTGGSRRWPTSSGRRTRPARRRWSRAIVWAHDGFVADGQENVALDPVRVPIWGRGKESAEIVTPAPRRLAVLGLGGTRRHAARGASPPRWRSSSRSTS